MIFCCKLTNEGLICSSMHRVRIMLHLGKANDTDGKSQDFQQDSVILGPRPIEASCMMIIMSRSHGSILLWESTDFKDVQRHSCILWLYLYAQMIDTSFCGNTCTHLGTESESDEPLWARFSVTCSRLYHGNVVATLCCDICLHLWISGSVPIYVSEI